MKKEQVFVVIDTEKKAKKIAKVLAMFNQKLASELLFKYCLQNNGYLHISKNSLKKHWVWSVPKSHLTMNDTEVSVSELKQILAMEHLKKGDVVKFRNEKGVFNICEITSINSHSCSYNSRYSSNSGFNHNDGSWEFKYFIRYATEEEKQLLNPGAKKVSKGTRDLFMKKATEYFDLVKNGKDLPLGTSIYIKDGIVGVDRDVITTASLLSSKFTNDLKMLREPKEIVGCIPVTDKKEDEKHTGSFESLRKCDTVDFPNDFREVENPIKDPIKGIWRYIGKQEDNELHKVDALIFDNENDASFGFNHGNEFTDSYGLKYNRNCFIRDATPYEVSERFFKECHSRYPNKISFSFNMLNNEITSGDEIVFKNGTWLEAKKIEIDPFKELKEAHKKGFEIEYKSSSGVWKTSSNPAWRKTGNYRIRTVKIGDWFFTTHEQTNVKYYYQVNETNINDVKTNHVRISNQMVIDILNNGKYTV